MDKLSDFIPLLIIIGSVIVSIVQSSNKKKEKQDMKKTRLPQGVPSEKPLGSPTVNLPKMKSAAVPSVSEKKTEKIPPLQTAFNPEVKRSVSSIPESDMSALNQDVPEVSGFVFDASNTDELKKAVIYSEILNRKEY